MSIAVFPAMSLCWFMPDQLDGRHAIRVVKGVRFRIVNSLVVFRCCCESHGCLEHCVTNIRVLFTTSWHAVMAAR